MSLCRTLIIQVELIGDEVDQVSAEIITDGVTEAVVTAFDAVPSQPGSTQAMVYRGSVISDYTSTP